MATLAESAGEPATVTIEGRTFTLSPISLREESALHRQLEAIAREDDQARNERAFRLIRQAPTEELRAEGMRELVRETKRGDPLSGYVIGEARASVKGVARELFARTRRFHPDVGVPEFEALLNPTNVDESFERLIESLAEMSKNDPTP